MPWRYHCLFLVGDCGLLRRGVDDVAAILAIARHDQAAIRPVLLVGRRTLFALPICQSIFRDSRIAENALFNLDPPNDSLKGYDDKTLVDPQDQGRLATG